jgi:predicted RND superfamily exporter protein
LLNGLDSIDVVINSLLTILDVLESDLETDGQNQYASEVYQIHSTLMTTQQSLTQLSLIPDETNDALAQLDQSIDLLLSNLSEQLSQTGQLSDQMLLLSSSLSDMSDTLLTIHSYSDSFEPSLPKTIQTLENIIYENDGRRVVFDNFVIDDKYTMMQITLSGQVSKEQKQDIVDVVENTIGEYQYDGEYLLSGKAILDLSIQNSMVESMQEMLGLSVIIMVLILLVTFKVRWRILPLITVLLAVMITIGLMGYLSIPVTMVSMAVFPILIGLGIDYAIQFQNRYHELLKEGGQNE